MTGPDVIGALAIRLVSQAEQTWRTTGSAGSASVIERATPAAESDRTNWQKRWPCRDGHSVGLGDSICTGVAARSASRIASAGPSTVAAPIWNAQTQATPARRIPDVLDPQINNAGTLLLVGRGNLEGK